MNNKPYILILIPGPKYQLKTLYGQRVELLSKSFSGQILTTSDPDAIEKWQIDNFTIESIACHLEDKMGQLKKLHARAKEIIQQQRKINQPVKLIVTYEPTKLGLLGVWLSTTSRCPLAVEVNGDYFVDEFYCDISSPIKRLISKIYLRFTVITVLLFASGIKLLHANQLRWVKKLLGNRVIRIFPDHTDITNFKPGQQQKLVLSAGFPFEIKGMDILIAAFKKVADKHPNWKLKIFGYVADMDLVNQHISGHQRIEYKPPVYLEDMPKELSSAKIFVLSSRTEAMGRVLIESAASGVARIGSDVGGIHTVIEDGVDGLLFEKENIDELADKLDLLMSDDALREKYSSAGRERFNDQYKIDYQNHCTAFYNDIINQKGKH